MNGAYVGVIQHSSLKSDTNVLANMYPIHICNYISEDH